MGNINRYSGIELDIACCQRPGSLNFNQYTLLTGPRFTFRRNPYVNPFAHVLLGIAYGRRAAPGYHSSARPGFASGFGGGIDVHAARYVWVRVIQADYVRESFRDDIQKNGRLSFGFVLRFGNLR
jgi:hypothetical protein